MRNIFRVRFAPQKALSASSDHDTQPNPEDISALKAAAQRVHNKSKFGCRECKARHVKCDETYPVCTRCLRRGSICLPAARSSRWIHELPRSILPHGNCPYIDNRQFQYWLENASQILVIDPENNPWSFPILKYVEHSASLAYALQSISIGHQSFFDAESRPAMLKARVQAIAALQQELQGAGSLITSFLTTYLLGISAACIDMDDVTDFGQQYLTGARAIMGHLLAEQEALSDSFKHFAFGVHVYWEMATAFLCEPEEQPTSDLFQIYEGIQQTKHLYHPLAGFSLEVMYTLIAVGRYCRKLIETGQRELDLETAFEEQMLDWDYTNDEPNLALLNESFRNAGLVLLYRVCAHQPRNVDYSEEENDITSHLSVSDAMIRQYSMKVVDGLVEAPMTSHCLNLHPLPLLTAASELEASDERERSLVLARFRAIYSLNRLPVCLWAIELLEDIWSLRDQGVRLSWLEIMLQKNWKLVIG